MGGAMSSIFLHKQTPPLSALNYFTVEMLTTLDDTADSHRCQSQILVKNRDFCPSYPCRNIGI